MPEQDFTLVKEMLQKLDQKTDIIAENVGKILTWQAVHQVEASNRQGQIDGLCESIYGNGKEGLKDKVSRLVAESDAKKEPSKLQQIVIGAAQTMVATILLSFLAWMMFIWKNHP